jgi:hypothetical protein
MTATKLGRGQVMKLELKVVKEPEDVSNEKNGDWFLVSIRIGDAEHHLDLIRVVEDEDGTQRPENPEYQEMYDDAQRYYAAKAYETIDGPEVLGVEGQFVAIMTPKER